MIIGGSFIIITCVQRWRRRQLAILNPPTYRIPWDSHAIRDLDLPREAPVFVCLNSSSCQRRFKINGVKIQSETPLNIGKGRTLFLGPG
ncbi:hypothetical protein CEXT_437921 [Caerostris extrusa]|uniref:Uncharacterized protein n=1 Tax=Caerostris extrusa TaxID=172846 RepID=A0AAV4Q2W6_CAEEX|nr:hypothetical protein CEXT_437921 [Caerostris extrusa]